MTREDNKCALDELQRMWRDLVRKCDGYEGSQRLLVSLYCERIRMEVEELIQVMEKDLKT